MHVFSLFLFTKVALKTVVSGHSLRYSSNHANNFDCATVFPSVNAPLCASGSPSYHANYNYLLLIISIPQTPC